MRLHLLVLLLVSVFFSLIDIEKRTIFSWDQARDAQVLFDLIQNHHLILIGPRALGPDSFFLGPLWYYLLLPFYFVTHLNPIASSYFFIFASISTTLAFYFVGKVIFNEKIALISAFLYLPTGQIITWNPALIPLSTLIYIYLLYKILTGKFSYIPPAFLAFGLSIQIHTQAIFYIFPLTFTLFYYTRRNTLPFKQLLIGLFLFSLTLIPLIIFDIRHNLLETKTLAHFLTNNSSQTLFTQQLISSIHKFLNEVSTKVFPTMISSPILSITALVISMTGILSSHLSKQSKILLLSFLLAPALLFSLYSKPLSEYYFLLCLAPLLLGISASLVRLSNSGLPGKILFISAITLFTTIKIAIFRDSFSDTSLFHQKQAVRYLSSQNIDKIYNVSYSTPANADITFKYLFSLTNHQPEDSPYGHLWTIVLPKDAENIPPLVSFGQIGIIRR